MTGGERRPRGVLGAATLCFLALAGALALFWIGWLAGGRGLGPAYGARAHGFALLAGAMCLLHGTATRGGAHALALLGGAWAVGLGAELLGLLTGQVFGRYRYADAVPWKILGLVPAVVPVVWAVVSYLAWTASGAWRPRVGQPLARAALAAALFVAYDLVADPNHLYRGGWVYEDGGAYHGVPLHNFIGWATLGFLTFFALARLEPRLGARGRLPAPGSWAERLPVAAYATIVAHEALFAMAFPRAWLPAALGLAAAAGALLGIGRRPRGVSAPASGG
jgi:putative membrane protein